MNRKTTVSLAFLLLPALLMSAKAGAFDQLKESSQTAPAKISIPAPASAVAGPDAVGAINFKSFPAKLGRYAPFETEFAKLRAATGIQAETKYAVLKKLFEQGAPAAQNDLTGWYSGRYVTPNDPNTLFGTLMAGIGMVAEPVAGSPTEPDGGPLFPPVQPPAPKYFFRIALPAQQTDTAYYDNLTKDILSDVNRLIERVKASAETRSVVKISFPEAAGTYAGNDIAYRKNGNYIIEELLFKTDAASVTTYSYYYKDVTPKP